MPNYSPVEAVVCSCTYCSVWVLPIQHIGYQLPRTDESASFHKTLLLTLQDYNLVSLSAIGKEKKKKKVLGYFQCNRQKMKTLFNARLEDKFWIEQGRSCLSPPLLCICVYVCEVEYLVKDDFKQLLDTAKSSFEDCYNKNTIILQYKQLKLVS